MEIIRSHQAHTIQSSTTCIATEYQTADPNINIARIVVKGRFPEHGAMRNLKVKELVYVERGLGSVKINGVEASIQQGDVIFYEKGELVSWSGDLTLVIACTPAWTPQQHEMVD